MRVPVVDERGIPLMPCSPPKARVLLKEKKAFPKRNKLGVFYIQLAYAQEPDNQPLILGADPGATYEGFSVVGTQDTVLNLMVEAPTHVKKAVKTRSQMRRARRFRKWRRPARFDNRRVGRKFIPPSTRSRWEAKARIGQQLKAILPITEAVVEDVQAKTRPGKKRKWNQSFSPVQVGKAHLYRLLSEMGWRVTLRHGWETKELRDTFGLKKCKTKGQAVFETHAVDAWVLAASVSGATRPTETGLWYVVPGRLHRRQLHRLQASPGGERKPYGGTRSRGLKRGTLVRHPKYGLCSVGGCDPERQTVSLHAYRTHARLTQGAEPGDCQIVTSTSWRSWYISAPTKLRKGAQRRSAIAGGASSTRFKPVVSAPQNL